MSNLSQFYNTSTSGFIEFEALILSGGGGGGANGPGGGKVPAFVAPGWGAGGGGGGAVYYGLIAVAPGTTCQITVGGGGAGSFNNISPPGIPTTGPYQGANGGDSTLKTPTFTYRVVGGGGGGGSFAIGEIGGTGGGSHEGYAINPGPIPRSDAFKLAGAPSVYSVGGNKHASLSNAITDTNRPNPLTPPINNFQFSGAFNSHTSGIFPFKNGFYSGFPGGGVSGIDIVRVPGLPADYQQFAVQRSNTGGGGAGGSSYRGYPTIAPYPSPQSQFILSDIGGPGFMSAIRGSDESGTIGPSELGRGASAGISTGAANTGNGGGGALGSTVPAEAADYQGIGGNPGGSGIVIVSYPNAFAAVAAQNRPGSVDVSPFTPGRYTYKFPSPGSIKFP